MGRGPKKHMTRLNAPNHWMLDKFTGLYAPKASAGPHKTAECLPIVVFLRNRLKYALTYHEAKMILKQRLVSVNGKVRTDLTYPAGFMDVISLEKCDEHFRLLYDVKGRYAVHRISADEAKYYLGKVKRQAVGPKGVPYIVTHDGRTIRYPDPSIKVNDTIKYEFETGTIKQIIAFDVGVQVMVTGGRNTGRVGTLVHRDRHPGAFDIVHIKDSLGHVFATRLQNVFVIGNGTKKPLITLPKGKGVKLTIAEERDRRMADRAKQASQ